MKLNLDYIHKSKFSEVFLKDYDVVDVFNNDRSAIMSRGMNLVDRF